MAITNLTGTKWQLNNTITLPSTDMSYRINGTMSSGNYNFVSPTKKSNAIRLHTAFLAFPSIYSPAATETGVQYISYENKKWRLGSSYNTILQAPIFDITGGEDVTNATLISWLQSNATLQQTTPTYSFKR